MPPTLTPCIALVDCLQDSPENTSQTGGNSRDFFFGCFACKIVVFLVIFSPAPLYSSVKRSFELRVINLGRLWSSKMATWSTKCPLGGTWGAALSTKRSPLGVHLAHLGPSGSILGPPEATFGPRRGKM